MTYPAPNEATSVSRRRSGSRTLGYAQLSCVDFLAKLDHVVLRRLVLDGPAVAATRVEFGPITSTVAAESTIWPSAQRSRWSSQSNRDRCPYLCWGRGQLPAAARRPASTRNRVEIAAWARECRLVAYYILIQ